MSHTVVTYIYIYSKGVCKGVHPIQTTVVIVMFMDSLAQCYNLVLMYIDISAAVQDEACTYMYVYVQV